MLLHRGFLSRLMVLAAIAVVAGCSVLAPKPDFTRYYRLEALKEKISPSPPPDPTLALAVYQVKVPGYLDRPQMVTDLKGDQINQDEYHQWAEPLQTGIARVLAQDIGLMSDSTHVAAFPLNPGFGQEFEAYIQVDQFDGAPGGIVTLQASWRITGPGGKPNYTRLHEITFTRKAEATADPADGYLEALNKLVGDLARDIVGALPQVQAAKAASVASP